MTTISKVCLVLLVTLPTAAPLHARTIYRNAAGTSGVTGTASGASGSLTINSGVNSGSYSSVTVSRGSAQSSNGTPFLGSDTSIGQTHVTGGTLTIGVSDTMAYNTGTSLNASIFTGTNLSSGTLSNTGILAVNNAAITSGLNLAGALSVSSVNPSFGTIIFNATTGLTTANSNLGLASQNLLTITQPNVVNPGNSALVTPQFVPEPSTLVLLAGGLVLQLRRARKNRL